MNDMDIWESQQGAWDRYAAADWACVVAGEEYEADKTPEKRKAFLAAKTAWEAARDEYMSLTENYYYE